MVTKFNACDTKIPNTSGLVTKTQYGSDKQGLDTKCYWISYYCCSQKKKKKTKTKTKKHQISIV